MVSAIVSTVLIGCMSTTVHYDIDTRVTEDGEVLRSKKEDVTYENSPAERKEIDNQVRRYKSGEAIPSDYVRTSDKTDETSQNIIRVNILDLFIYKHITYEEIFQDVTDTEKAITTAMKLYEEWKTMLVNHITAETHNRFSRDETMSAISDVYDPPVIELANIFKEKGIEGMDVYLDSDATKQYSDDDWVANRIAIVLSSDISQNDALIRSIKSALTMTDEPSDLISQDEWVDLFGIRDFCFFSCRVDKFSLSLKLPGQLTHHNGRLLDDGRVLWIFKGEDFVYEPFVLKAQSRLFYPVRLVVAGVASVLLLTISIVIKKRRRVISNH